MTPHPARLLPLILLLVCSLVCTACFGDDFPASDTSQSDAEWERLEDDLTKQRLHLAELIAEADDKGVATDYARVSMQTIAAFHEAARHDHEHMDGVRAAFQTFGYYKRVDPIETERLPYKEMEACIEVAERAVDELERQLRGEIRLAPSPDFREGRLRLAPRYCTLDGRIVFPYTITWMGSDEEMMRAFGRMGGGYYALANLREDGTVSPGLKTRNREKAASQAERNMGPASFFLGHAAPSWLSEKHPEVLHGGRKFTQYDIDSPLVRDALSQLCQEMLPAWSEACGDLPRMHLLANEPHFATSRGGWLARNGLSDHTMRKYHEWLATKYETIDALNAAYGASFAAFGDVTFHDLDPNLPETEQYASRQIDPKLRGGPVWYDWCRFNMDRVNDWFTFLKQQTQSNDPNHSPVTIKMLGFTLSRNTRDGGMDLEYLTKLQDIAGADLRAAPRDAIFFGKYEEGLTPETDWRNRYAYDWIEQAMYLDFTKSLCPDKMFYDSEWHGFGAVSWRHFQLDRDYVRSALWIAFSHGMGAIQPWVWGRDANGAMNPRTDHIGELSTQPIALDAYGRVMKELNAHAESVVRFVPRERTFLIFYCEEAAIQDESYTGDMKTVYEACKLLNLPVGFTTPSEIGRLNAVRQIVLVPPTAFIKDESLAALKAYQQSGGRVLAFNAERCFLKNEAGAARDGDAPAWSGSLPLEENVHRLADTIRDALAPWIANDGIDAPYGVLIQQTVDPATGERLVLLNNVAKDERIVRLESGGAAIRDVLQGREVGATLRLDPCDVRMLRIER